MRIYAKTVGSIKRRILRAFAQLAAGKPMLEIAPSGHAGIAVESIPAAKMAFAVHAGRASFVAAILMKAILFEQLNRRKAPN